jgi:AraC family transcriptional regulator
MEKNMDYRIEQVEEFTLIGFSIKLNSKDGSHFLAIPQFWQTLMDDSRFAILAKNVGKSKLGICGVSHSMDMESGNFVYSIAVEKQTGNSAIPETAEIIFVPASTFAKFTAKGPCTEALQATVRKIYGEWFQSSGKEHAGTPEIEYYPPVDIPLDSPDYWCEYWVPIKASGGK